jgi:hypothetical protein
MATAKYQSERRKAIRQRELDAQASFDQAQTAWLKYAKWHTGDENIRQTLGAFLRMDIEHIHTPVEMMEAVSSSIRYALLGTDGEMN